MPKPSHAGKLEQNVQLCNEINVATNNIGHEVTNNAKTFSCRETQAKCTLCNEINVAMKNIGHEVTNNNKKLLMPGNSSKMHFMQ